MTEWEEFESIGLEYMYKRYFYPMQETRRSYLNVPRQSGWTGFRSAILVSDEVVNWPVSRDVNIDVYRLKNDPDYQKMLHDIIVLSLLVPHRLDIPLWMVMSDVGRLERYMDYGNSKFRGIS